MKTLTLDNSHTTVNENDNKNSGKLFEITDIENSPIKCISMEEGHFLALGNQRITETYESKEQLIKYYNKSKIDWNLLTNVIFTIINLNKQHNG